jgi:uncharacterized protein with GYD domain
MPVAFVLVETEVGRISDVLNKLQSIEEVVEVYSVAGPYSIIAKIEAESFEQLAKIVPEKIHRISGITKTLTLLAFGTAKTFRIDACARARELEKAGKLTELYQVCRGCGQLKFCSFGTRVVTFGF